jgi:microcystin-dependent protein
MASMSKLHASLQAVELILICLIPAFAFWVWMNPPAAGVALPQGVAIFETSLQGRISASDTSMTLVANSVRGGSTLSGYQCFTVDEGRSDAEFICGTISGTTVSSLVRGVDPVTATSTNATLKFSHRVGASVKITDFPLIQRIRNLANGIETFPNPLYVDVSTSTLSTLGTSTVATKEYVDYVGTSGCADGSDTARGCVETAIGTEASAGTSLGATGARLVLGANLGTSTCQVLTNSVLVASSTTGKLGGNCLDTGYAYTWTTTNTFSGTVNFTGAIQDEGVAGGLVPIGTVLPYATSTAPTGWLAADGSAVSRTTYANLFTVVGITYGTGDGVTTFNLPDLRGKNVVMASSTQSRLDTYGETNTATTTVLTQSHLPNISIDVPSNNNSGTQGTGNAAYETSTGANDTIAVSLGGASLPVPIMDPYLVMNYIIKY